MVKRRDGSLTVYTEVEVEIDGDDLRGSGYHHESDCKTVGPVVGDAHLLAAMEDLHQQAHGDRWPFRWCPESPCSTVLPVYQSVAS